MVTLSERYYAYATFKGVVKEVYEIHIGYQLELKNILKFNSERLAKARWEFVGRKAPEKIRSLYVGNIIERKRSYSDPFIKVGFEY